MLRSRLPPRRPPPGLPPSRQPRPPRQRPQSIAASSAWRTAAAATTTTDGRCLRLRVEEGTRRRTSFPRLPPPPPRHHHPHHRRGVHSCHRSGDPRTACGRRSGRCRRSPTSSAAPRRAAGARTRIAVALRRGTARRGAWWGAATTTRTRTASTSTAWALPREAWVGARGAATCEAARACTLPAIAVASRSSQQAGRWKSRHFRNLV